MGPRNYILNAMVESTNFISILTGYDSSVRHSWYLYKWWWRQELIYEKEMLVFASRRIRLLIMFSLSWIDELILSLKYKILSLYLSSREYVSYINANWEQLECQKYLAELSIFCYSKQWFYTLRKKFKGRCSRLTMNLFFQAPNVSLVPLFWFRKLKFDEKYYYGI